MTNMVVRSRSPRYVNIAEAKTRLSELVDKASLGEEIVIAKDHRPVAKLVPLGPTRRARKPGSGKGQIWIAADFDTTPADIAKYLE